MNIMPNATAFEKLLDAILAKHPGIDQNKAIADEWGIARQTAEKLLKGRPVGESTILQVARRIKVLPADLISSTVVQNLPARTDFYTQLKYGYFIDQPRTATDVDAEWNREEISLEIDAADGEWKWFTGKITNTRHGHFTARACLIHQNSFAILASNDHREDAFVASFSCLTHQLDDPTNKVICGVWSGRDHLSRLAVYRMFCSIKKLEQDQIQELLKITPIMPNFKPADLPAESKHKKK